MKSSNISFLIILRLIFSSGINSSILRYVNESKGWNDAVAHCNLINGRLFSLTEDELYSFGKCHRPNNVEFPLWTDYIETLSEWIETNYCYTIEDIKFTRNVTISKAVTPYACQQYCNETPLFAHGPHGGCFCNVSKPNADHEPYCHSSYQYRLYRVVEDKLIKKLHCEGDQCNCIYQKCNGNVGSCNGIHLYAAGCHECRDVRCQKDNEDNSLSWFDAVSFCNQSESMLRITGILFAKDNYKWIGVSRDHAYISSMYVLPNSQNVIPTTCFTKNQDFMVRKSDCGIQRNFFCKIDVDVDDRKTDDCDILISPQASAKSMLQKELKRTTCNQKTTTTGNTYASTMYSTTSKPTTQHGPAVSFKKDKSSDMMTIIGAVIGAVLVIIIASILLIFTLKQRNKTLCRNSENNVKQKKSEGSNDISSIKLNTMNINNKRSDCYSFAAFEKDNNSVPVIKQESNQRHNPIYEPSGLQKEIRPCDKSDHLYQDNRLYENKIDSGTRHEQDYGDYNLSNTNTSIPAQNLYDSSVGIYNHINHGPTQDHMEDNYDHFHGSDQDYDQIENKQQRANASSEYSYRP